MHEVDANIWTQAHVREFKIKQNTHLSSWTWAHARIFENYSTKVQTRFQAHGFQFKKIWYHDIKALEHEIR